MTNGFPARSVALSGCISATALLLVTFSAVLLAQEGYESARMEMIAEVEAMVADTRSYTGIEVLDSKVMQAVAAVPRHEFVPPSLRAFAYLNNPLPIGEGQTISQPYIVALMTHLMELDEDMTVLEIGTGSGYQAAVLAHLARHVYTIEIIETLGRRAAATLARLGYDNVTVKIGDGYIGWDGTRAFRRNHRHCSPRESAPTPDRPVKTRRTHGGAGRPATRLSIPAGTGKTGIRRNQDHRYPAGRFRPICKRRQGLGLIRCLHQVWKTISGISSAGTADEKRTGMYSQRVPEIVFQTCPRN